MSRSEPTPQPLSIWVVNPFDDVPGEGLPPLRFWTLCRVLAGRGHDVTWWTADWSHRRKAARGRPPRLVAEEEGFGIRQIPVRPYFHNVSLARRGSHRDFGRGFERLATEAIASGGLERPDIILASLPPLEGPEAAARLASRLDAVLVVDLMDMWPETFRRLLPGPEWLRRIAAPLLLGGMERRRRQILEKADGVSAATRSFAESALDGVAGDRPVHVCHLGAYLQEYPDPPRPLPFDDLPTHAAPTPDDGGDGHPGKADRPLACVYSGTLERGQDLDTIVAAARILSAAGTTIDFHVAGGGRLEGKMKSEAQSLPGPCRLIVHGLLPRGAYAKLLAECDVGLVAVKPESLVAVPYKACDYAAAGLVLVNSLPGELAEMIADYSAGVSYSAGDASSLATVLGELAGDRRRLLGLRQGSRRLAAERFDREVTYSRFALWLESLAG
jgi:glycosyltransferase involved in cell wall biosynthesis